MQDTKIKNQNIFSFLFIFLPLIFTIIGLSFFSYGLVEEHRFILYIPLFSSLFLLLIGFLLKDKISNILKIMGWMIFSFYWSTQINLLYYAEMNDIFNAVMCVIGVFVLSYLAYHEYLTYNGEKDKTCLDWIAAASAISGLIYFSVELTPLKDWLIGVVAYQSGLVLNLFLSDVTVDKDLIYCAGRGIISIIFACTAVQSMVIFVGMILPIPKLEIKRKIIGLLITIVPIYFLNLIRNALIAYIVYNDPTQFEFAHNILGKGLSLVALIILLFFVIKMLPEVFDQINCLIDLSKRKGPIEKLFIRKKNK